LVVSTTPYTGRSGSFDPEAVDDGADAAGELVAVVVVPSDLVVLVDFSSALPPQAASSATADTAAAHRMIAALISVP
jgi:hypothetical protein